MKLKDEKSIILFFRVERQNSKKNNDVNKLNSYYFIFYAGRKQAKFFTKLEIFDSLYFFINKKTNHS